MTPTAPPNAPPVPTFEVRSPGAASTRLWEATDSIDFCPSTNAVALRAAAMHRGRRWRALGVTGLTATMLTTTVVSGLLIGVTAALVERTIAFAESWRNSLLASAYIANLELASLVHLSLALCSIVLTAALVQLLAPGAAGSGVSLLMAFLNGNDVTGLLTPGVYVIKLFGTVAARFAGLALGPEAPLIHLGACVSSIVFRAERYLLSKTSSHIKVAQHQQHQQQQNHSAGMSSVAFTNAGHREMVSAGSAAGLAAAFGAPVGGVLFALEEACSVWSRKTAWRCLLCTAAAVMTMSQLTSGAILSLSGIYPLSSQQWIRQLPSVIFVALGAGFLGAIFNLLRRYIQRLRASRRRHTLRLLEAGFVSVVTVVVMMVASSTVGRCLDLPPTWDKSAVVQYSCPPGQYNDLITAMLGQSSFVIRSILGLGSTTEPINAQAAANNLCTLTTPCYFSPSSLGILCIIYLLLMVISSGLAVPGGMFMPSILVGGSFGAAVAMTLSQILPPSWDVQPGVYALVGATATLAAVFRSTISLVVIMVEATRGIEFLPGILAAAIISNFIAHWVHPDGVYEGELEADGRVFFLRQEPPGNLRWKTAESLMASPVIGMRAVEPVSKVVEMLTSTGHNGFPVYGEAIMSGDEDWHTSSTSHLGTQGNARCVLLGFILRSQLLVLLREGAFCDRQGNYIQAIGDENAYEAALDRKMHTATCPGEDIELDASFGTDLIGPLERSDVEEGQAVASEESVQTFRKLREGTPLLDTLLGRPGNGEGDGWRQMALHNNPRMLVRNSQNVLTSFEDLYLNVNPFMDRGMLSARPFTPAAVVHQMFVGLSLRHLCVTNSHGQVLGIITRKDLDNAAGRGWWRANKIAPQPVREEAGLEAQRSWLSTSIQAILARLTPVAASTQARVGQTDDHFVNEDGEEGDGGEMVEEKEDSIESTEQVRQPNFES